MSLTIHQRPSPNHNARPPGTTIDTVILHCDASKTVASSLSWIQSPRSKVSYHYLIGRLGHVYQCVPDEARAWHAGRSDFLTRPDCNDYSIGVAFSNRNDGEPYPEAQVQAAAELCAHLMDQHPAITLHRITMHKTVARPLGRKSDPADPFDYAAFLARVDAIAQECDE